VPQKGFQDQLLIRAWITSTALKRRLEKSVGGQGRAPSHLIRKKKKHSRRRKKRKKKNGATLGKGVTT